MTQTTCSLPGGTDPGLFGSEFLRITENTAQAEVALVNGRV